VAEYVPPVPALTSCDTTQSATAKVVASKPRVFIFFPPID
jgi:hypothetical protein